MRKLIFPIALISITALSFSFMPKAPKAPAHGGSSIEWIGKKFGGDHRGTVNFKETDMAFSDGNLVSANFVVDMTSMKCTDLDEDMGGKLVGHLEADDFFGTKKFPTASFKSSKVEALGGGGYNISGDLTIKEISQPISFQAKISAHGNHVSASTRLNIDRTKYGIKYKSKSMFDGLGDNFIYDDFVLNIKIHDHL